MSLNAFPYILEIQNGLEQGFPYFAKVVNKRISDFGDAWARDFNKELEVFFGDDHDRLENAVKGYGIFALDGMKLQKKFDKDQAYINRTYAEVADKVYMNKEYMFGLYLPGILLSQYLWAHHYRQLRCFRERFVPMVLKQNAGLFFDVGVGTGFYSKEMLANCPQIKGQGYDISPHSIEHTLEMVQRWGLQERYNLEKRDILKTPPTGQPNCIVSVEVLEHLENPLDFLKGLFGLLRLGGIGFITAAITAPNADHIYLYRSLDELRVQVTEAGFTILESEEYAGYEPRSNESVPINGVCLVKKGE